MSLVEETKEPYRDTLITCPVAILKGVVAVTTVASLKHLFDLHGILIIEIKESQRRAIQETSFVPLAQLIEDERPQEL